MKFFRSSTIVLLSLLLGSLSSLRVCAQVDGETITIGKWRVIESKVLGETRRVSVGLPAGYKAGEEKYPVLYVLDGPQHFHHTTGLIKFLAQQDIIPKMIVVAVDNTDRTRDMTPPTRDTENPLAKGSGGADNFIAFFRDELIPFVDQNYRTRPYRVLVGHSFGGLFALHTLVHAPEVFDGYVAISPSLWWDDQMLVEQADSIFSSTKELNKALYMTMGSEGGDMLGGMLKLEGVLTEHSPKGFEWSSQVMKEETHGSVPYRSTRQGLEYIFRHWGIKNPVPIFDQGGVEAVYSFFDRAEKRYGMKRGTPPAVLTNLATSLAQNGRLEESIAVLEHDPENIKPPAILYEMIARKYEEREESDNVIKCYSRALEINPANESVRLKLVKFGVDADAIAPVPVKLTDAQLAEYVGDYFDADEGKEVTIKVVDGQLVVGGDSPSLNLKTLELDRFVFVDQPVEVVFSRDNTGKVIKLTVQLGGEVLGEAKRKE